MSRSEPQIAKSIISSLRRELAKIIKQQVVDDEVCVFLSGRADSTTVALAAHHLGKKITAISYQLGNKQNEDCEIAERTCAAMGWQFHKVIVPTEDVSGWFLKLINDYECVKKTEVEMLYPVIFMIERAKSLGFSKVLTGFGSPLPHSRSNDIQARDDIAAYWQRMLDEGGIISSATTKCIVCAANDAIEILMPLTHSSFIKRLARITTVDELDKPYPKAPYKLLYERDFQRFGLLKSRYLNLQKGGGLEQHFAQVLDDENINTPRYVKGSLTNRMTPLIKHWAKQHSKPIRYHRYTMKDVWDAADEKRFTTVSLFAGGGGSSTGYKLAGGDLLLANEFVDEAIKSYQMNYPLTPVAPVDLRKINKGKMYVEMLFDEYEVDIDSVDILDGSPPCATFSQSGKADKADRKGVAYSDVTQDRLGYLIHDYVFFASCVQPKVCVIENVLGIARSDMFVAAANRLRKNGYLLNHKVLNAVEFGVPQMRKRFFAVAIRKDVAAKVGIKSEREILSIFPRGTTKKTTLREALEGVEVSAKERHYLKAIARKSSQYELVRSLPKNPTKNTGMKDIQKSWSSDVQLRRLSWDDVAQTLTQQDSQSRTLGGSHHPEEDRKLTISELKRIQALPDDFILTGTFDQQAERIGRMVPPMMTKYLAQSIYEKVFLPFSKAKN